MPTPEPTPEPTPKPTKAPTPEPAVGYYTPPGWDGVSDLDCGDFDTHADAQSFFIGQGGPSSDPHRLDADNDGIACESLP
jgi:micrococcal nuclease